MPKYLKAPSAISPSSYPLHHHPYPVSRTTENPSCRYRRNSTRRHPAGQQIAPSVQVVAALTMVYLELRVACLPAQHGGRYVRIARRQAILQRFAEQVQIQQRIASPLFQPYTMMSTATHTVHKEMSKKLLQILRKPVLKEMV